MDSAISQLPPLDRANRRAFWALLTQLILLPLAGSLLGMLLMDLIDLSSIGSAQSYIAALNSGVFVAQGVITLIVAVLLLQVGRLLTAPKARLYFRVAVFGLFIEAAVTFLQATIILGTHLGLKQETVVRVMSINQLPITLSNFVAMFALLVGLGYLVKARSWWIWTRRLAYVALFVGLLFTVWNLAFTLMNGGESMRKLLTALLPLGMLAAAQPVLLLVLYAEVMLSLRRQHAEVPRGTGVTDEPPEPLNETEPTAPAVHRGEDLCLRRRVSRLFWAVFLLVLVIPALDRVLKVYDLDPYSAVIINTMAILVSGSVAILLFVLSGRAGRFWLCVSAGLLFLKMLLVLLSLKASFEALIVMLDHQNITGAGSGGGFSVPGFGGGMLAALPALDLWMFCMLVGLGRLGNPRHWWYLVRRLTYIVLLLNPALGVMIVHASFHSWFSWLQLFAYLTPVLVVLLVGEVTLSLREDVES